MGIREIAFVLVLKLSTGFMDISFIIASKLLSTLSIFVYQMLTKFFKRLKERK